MTKKGTPVAAIAPKAATKVASTMRFGSTTPRTVDFVLTDGDGGVSNTAQQTVNVTSVNDAPTALNNTLAIDEDTSHVFTLSDFNFADVEGDSLSKVQITSLESAGSLQLSGVDVTLNQVITAADITAGNLTFTPAADASGAPYDSFGFKVHDGTTYSASAYTMTVNVIAVNDAPIVATPGAALSYTENDPATIIDATATVSDVDLLDFNGGQPWRRGVYLNLDVCHVRERVDIQLK